MGVANNKRHCGENMRELLNDCFVLEGDCLERLKELPEKSIHTCVTSPPYYGLRDYGTGEWVSDNAECDHVEYYIPHTGDARKGRDMSSQVFQYSEVCGKCGAKRKDSQIGLEKTPEEFIQNLVHVFREVRRVLRDDGTLWLNMGDSYWGGKGASGQGDSAYQEARVAEGKSFNKGHHQIGGQKQTRPTDNSHETFKPKDLMMIPHRLAIALQDDGWWVRQDIVWAKPNPMPESVKDRCTKAHEYIFLLSKSKHYYYDHEAVKERTSDSYMGNRGKTVQRHKTQSMMKDRVFDTPYSHEMRRNRHSVWSVNVLPYSEAHFAVYPPDLIEPCILAGCPKGGTVLDPFGGSGTTAGVALKHGRKAIVCELNPEYVDLMPKRIEMISGRSKEQRTLFDW